MKTTLTLILAGATLALSSCQQQETPVTPTTETTAPIVVTPVKSEISYAPESVDGKFLEIGKPNASKFYWECEFNVGDNHAHYTHQEAEYTKTGANTAKLEYVITYPGAQEKGVFKLKFTSPTGGIVIGKGVSFTLK